MTDQELHKSVHDLKGKVDEIYTAIMGSKFNERGGYKPRLENLETRVDNIEDLINKWKWIMIGAIGLGGYGGLTFIQQIIGLMGESLTKAP